MTKLLEWVSAAKAESGESGAGGAGRGATATAVYQVLTPLTPDRLRELRQQAEEMRQDAERIAGALSGAVAPGNVGGDPEGRARRKGEMDGGSGSDERARKK